MFHFDCEAIGFWYIYERGDLGSFFNNRGNFDKTSIAERDDFM